MCCPALQPWGQPDIISELFGRSYAVTLLPWISCDHVPVSLTVLICVSVCILAAEAGPHLACNRTCTLGTPAGRRQTCLLAQRLAIG